MKNQNTFAIFCADICEKCTIECAKHQTEHCQECAQACKGCADECSKMAA
ncbi:MAG TPA: four-helix bundle copper-binding protein [Flavisolibacter sp.]